ncbi:MAG: hypothetical protein GX444_10710 [Myxococcales bacterium]|nr:hypothetical protein [Myxococcales bacterium]
MIKAVPDGDADNYRYSDRYYSDLDATHLWDRNLNGNLAEFGGDYCQISLGELCWQTYIYGLKLEQDIIVGRIPVYYNSTYAALYDTQALNCILSRTIAFQEGTYGTAYRQKVFLAASMIRLFDTRVDGHCNEYCYESKFDCSLTTQAIYTDIVQEAGFNAQYRLYDHCNEADCIEMLPIDDDDSDDNCSWDGNTYCSGSSTEDLNNSTYKATLYNQSFGVLLQFSHGSPDSSNRRRWICDLPVDNAPQSDNCQTNCADGEINALPFVYSSDIQGGYGSLSCGRTTRHIHYFGGCNMGKPDDLGNLAYKMLRWRSAASIASTITGWATNDCKNFDTCMTDYGMQEIRYRWADFAIRMNLNIGLALAYATEPIYGRLDMANYNQVLITTLYGDPQMSIY